MRIVCGMTAGAADSKISNQPVTFESNRKRPIRIRIDLEYLQVPIIMQMIFSDGSISILCTSLTLQTATYSLLLSLFLSLLLNIWFNRLRSDNIRQDSSLVQWNCNFIHSMSVNAT